MDDIMPGSTQELLDWLERRYPRPIFRARPEATQGLTDQFLIDTGKRQLVEELLTFWQDQNR